MRKPLQLFTSASAVAVVLATLAAPMPVAAESAVEEGKKIAFDRKKGNCLACHQIEGGDLPGNIGPPLMNMKQRFPDKSKLRSQIWDATRANPNSMMPPFGKHNILSESEIDKIVEYVYTL